MRIGITDTLKEDTFEYYVDWMKSADSTIDIEKLSYERDNVPEIQKLDGLVLAGGGDVHPRYYKKDALIAKAKGVDEKRDEFEFDVVEYALDAELPILGVCRGIQVMNVYLGGSLKVDLSLEGFGDHTSPDDGMTMHNISVSANSLLHALTGADEIEVNSFHHQGVDRLGKGLIRTAISTDNVTEAIEWAIKDNMPFLMLVQWHPERLAENFLSQKLASIFLREVFRFKLKKEQ